MSNMNEMFPYIMQSAAGRLRACGVIGQEAADKRDAVRRELQREGLSSYTDNTGLYIFTLRKTYAVQVVVDGGASCRLYVTGFMLSPQEDWKLMGFITATGHQVIGSRPIEVRV